MRVSVLATAIASATLFCQSAVAKPVVLEPQSGFEKREDKKEEKKKDPSLNKYFHEPG